MKYSPSKVCSRAVLMHGTTQDEEDEDEDKVSSLFDKARRSGAVQGTSSDLEQPSSSFRGQGRTLAGGPQVGWA
eukprot:683798-Pelagomonas_calceolata.AAC.3